MNTDWYFSEDILDQLNTANYYERVEDEHGDYEFIGLEAPSLGLNDPAVVDFYIVNGGAEINHRTNVDYNPLFKVLDRFYPPNSGDELWIGNSEKFEQQRLGEAIQGDINTFQFFRENKPCFDLEWNDLSHNHKEGVSTPFAFKINLYDYFGLSLERETTEPVSYTLPAMLRSDMEDEARGKLMSDIVTLMDYGVTSDSESSVVHFLEPEDLGSLSENAARSFDPHR